MMQISEANNNLLNIVAGQNAQKKDSEIKGDNFVDLLQLQNQLPEILPQTAQVQTSVQRSSSQNINLSSKSAEKTVYQNQTESYESVRKENAPKVENEDNTTNEMNAENIEETDVATVDGVVSEEVSTPNEAQNVDSDEVVVPATFVVDVVDPLNVLPQVAVENDDNELSIVNNESVELISVENQDITPTSEVAIIEDGDVVESQSELKQPEALTEQAKEQNNKPVMIEKEVRQKIEKQPVVQEQEAKIAEILPEDKKVEIKVSVKEDKVTSATLKNTQVSVENIEVIEATPAVNTKTEKTEEILPIQTNKNENRIQTAQPIAVETEDYTINEYQVLTPDQHGIENINIIASAQAVHPIVEEMNSVGETSNISTTKEIYINKGLTREVAEQIKVNITQSAIKGVDKIEIQLKPVDLGQVEIKLQIAKDGKIQAHIIASNTETLEVLQKDASVLKEAFNAAGYLTDDNNFSFSYRGEEQSSNDREKLREFIGEVITQDVAAEAVANDYISTDGVNIRV